MGSWRKFIGHDGYFVATLRLTTPQEGGRSRAVQSGYHAQWWLVEAAGESWRGSGPIDIVSETRSIKPGQQGEVRIYPMDPAQWRDVIAGAVLHLRERVGQTLGVAAVTERVRVPQDAPLRLDAAQLPPGAAWLQPMSGADRAPQQLHPRHGWLGRPLPNWWLRFAVPALIIFGGTLAVRILFADTHDIAPYATVAALAMVALVVGLFKARRSTG